MPIATQSLTKVVLNNNNPSIPEVQNSVINPSQKSALVTGAVDGASFSSSEAQKLHLLQNAVDSNPTDKPIIFQQQQQLLQETSSTPTATATNTITTTSTTITTLTQQPQQPYDSLSLHVANANMNISPILNQVSPKDNQSTQSNNQNNNNNNVVQSSPPNLGTIVDLASIQSDLVLTTFMPIITSTEHGGSASAQLSSTTGPSGSIMEDLNVVTEQNSSRYLRFDY